jgi:hypothetical protein
MRHQQQMSKEKGLSVLYQGDQLHQGELLRRQSRAVVQVNCGAGLSANQTAGPNPRCM